MTNQQSLPETFEIQNEWHLSEAIRLIDETLVDVTGHELAAADTIADKLLDIRNTVREIKFLLPIEVLSLEDDQPSQPA